jgi:1-acyl-sn-glycerol-3-phosphate acyltransferase
LLGRLRIGTKNGLYALITLLCYAALKMFFRIRIIGRENIGRDDGYIAVARHRSYWDIPVMAVAIGIRRRVHFISRKGLMRGNLLIQPIIRTFSTIIDRENFGRGDFRKMLAAMKQERLIGIFPEGTTKERVDAKAGAVRFAQLTGKRILPVNIVSDGPYPPEYPFRFPRLTVSVGVPFDVSELNREEPDTESRAERYQRMSEELMLRVDNA